MITRQQFDQLQLPKMPDNSACWTTAIALGLTVLGRSTTPGALDKVCGRKRDLLHYENSVKLNLFLLGSGVRMEQINKPGSLNWSEFAQPGSKRTYAEYIGKLVAIYGNGIRSYWTPERYAEEVARYRDIYPKFAKYYKNGQLKETEARINGAFMRTRLGRNNFLIGKQGSGHQYASHSLALFSLDRSKVTAFTPGLDSNRELCLSEHTFDQAARSFVHEDTVYVIGL